MQWQPLLRSVTTYLQAVLMHSIVWQKLVHNSHLTWATLPLILGLQKLFILKLDASMGNTDK